MSFQYDFLKKIHFITPDLITLKGNAILRKTPLGDIVITTEKTISLKINLPPNTHIVILEYNDDKYYVILSNTVRLSSNEKKILCQEIANFSYREDFLIPIPCKICNSKFNYEELKEQFSKCKDLYYRKRTYSSYYNEEYLRKKYREFDIVCFNCLQLYIEAEKVERFCYECNKKIDIIECFMSYLNSDINYEKIFEIWINPIFQLFCCNHFKIGTTLFEFYDRKAHKNKSISQFQSVRLSF